MASLKKITTVEYRDKAGHRVPKGTPGAKKLKVRSEKWYGQYKDIETGTRKLIPLYTDKEASQTKLAELLKAQARGEVGLVDPHGQTKALPVADAMKCYLDDLRHKGRDDRYIYQQKVKLEKVFRECKIATLVQLTPDRLDAFLKTLNTSARTKNTYRQVCIGMMNFFVGKRKLSFNPLLQTSRASGEDKRRRRALLPNQLQLLLDAARNRPLDEQRIIRRGPRRGEVGANVKPAVEVRLRRIGRHRALLYFTAALTGLRLGSLRKMQVCHLTLDDRPALRLPGSIMKGGRDFAQPLHPDLVVQLQQWIADEGKSGTDTVFEVPSGVQVSKLLKKDLRKAGIPYRDEQGKYFDFHALRKCTGTWLRRAGVDPAVAMKFLDHKDIRLTMQVYNDDALMDMAPAIEAMPKLTL